MDGVIAKLSALPEGQPAEVEAEIDGGPESLIVLRRGDRVDAFLNVCPHAGRRLDWAPGKFLLSREGHLVCAAHGASFAMPAGECVAGPCRGDSLRRVALIVDGDEVRLGA
ncbi:Rieske (2Fe-2S) protein [Lysobacter xanthus]